MSRTAICFPAPRPARRVRALVVLAVLLGVMGMHGLASGASPAPPAHHTHMRATGHTAPATATDPAHHAARATTATASAACHHHGGAASAHADDLCVAAGLPTVPGPSALTAAPGTWSGEARTVPSVYPTGAAGRAPPSLAELQLLRI